MLRALTCAVVLLSAVSLLSGCGKKAVDNPQPAQPEAAPPPPPGAPPIQQTPASQAGQQLPAPVQKNGEVDLAELNRDVLRWMMRNRRRPASFEDFAATAGVRIPPPPAGKKYVLDKDMQIQLVNR